MSPGEQHDEAACGHEIARDAEVPELLGQLIQHVASNMAEHARWVEASNPSGAPEAVGLHKVAEHYGSIAKASESAAAAMRAMRDAPAAAHDPKLLDRATVVPWMQAKIEMQRRLAQMLLRHADDSERVLQRMGARGPTAK
jgi:hypothetical protein